MKKTLLFISMLACGITFAQSGTLDTTFGTSGYSIMNIGPLGDLADKILIQPDNKILSLGSAHIGDLNATAIALTRTNANGTPDTSFGGNGQIMTVAGNGDSTNGTGIALQNDGKIIVAGYCFNGDSHYDLLLIRYNSSGSIDTSFGTNGKTILDVGGINAQDNITAVTILPDGKIIVVGQTQTIANSLMPFATRFSSSGALDTTFGTNGTILIDFSSFYTFPVSAWMPFASNIIMLQDGNILISCRVGEGYSDLAFAKINANGSYNTNFGTGGKVIFTGPFFHDKCMTEQPDEKILISAKGTNPENQGPLYHIALRINSDGSPDTGFGTNGKLYIETSQAQYSAAIALQSDGRIVAIDTPDPFSDNTLIIRRFNNNGTIDTTFGINGSYPHDFPQLTSYVPQDLKVLADGKIIAGVTIRATSNSGIGLMRFNGGETANINEYTANELTIYPNPTSNILNISNPENITLDGVSVADITGKTVLQQTGNLYQIDVQNLSQGMYFLKLTSGNTEYQHKFIKQ